MDKLVIAEKSFDSRLFLGTGKFSSYQMMQESIKSSGSEMITVALRRLDTNLEKDEDELLNYIDRDKICLLPNTSGARNAEEAIYAANLSREAFNTNWIKLEIHPNTDHLMPDPIETLLASERLVKEGFIVLPYIHADPILCKRLEDVGVPAVMPLAATIGSNKGLEAMHFLEIIIQNSNIPVIVDAGIGASSDASKAMEMGADAVLVNTAIAVAKNPIVMANSFRLGVMAGRTAFLSEGAKFFKKPSSASSPQTDFLI